MAGAVDYAGLFPPAALGMGEAVRNYAAYRTGTQAWMLGRLIVPVARLGECRAAADALADTPGACTAWNLSALSGRDVAADIRAIRTFNETGPTAPARRLVIDTIEFRAVGPAEITRARPELAGDLQVYVEIPVDTDPAPLLAAIGDAGWRAKVRTGGVAEESFPSPRHLARFILGCVRSGLMFKATAGLHHPLRGRYPLTYDAASPRAMMYGFLNVFLATGAAAAGGSEEEVRQILEETDPGTLRMDPEGISWRHRRLSLNDVTTLRARFAASFGSCSFEEPLNDLRQMGLP